MDPEEEAKPECSCADPDEPCWGARHALSGCCYGHMMCSVGGNYIPSPVAVALNLEKIYTSTLIKYKDLSFKVILAKALRAQRLYLHWWYVTSL